MVGCHDTEGYASLHPRLRATRYTRAFDLSGRAAGLFYHGFSQNLGGFTQYCANLCHVCANLVFFICDWVVLAMDIYGAKKRCNRAFGSVASFNILSCMG